MLPTSPGGVLFLLGTLLLVAIGCNHDAEIKTLTANAGTDVVVTDGDGDADPDPDPGPDGEPDPIDEDACLPCDSVTTGSLRWESCCAGPGNLFCGFRETADDSCLRLGVAGEANPGCPGVDALCAGDNCANAAGCCRPDGHCGLVLPGIDGCIDRVEVPGIVGGPFELRLCAFDCERDADCSRSGEGFICTVRSVEPLVRACARECFSDLDCVKQEICALGNNDVDQRVESTCQRPIGTGTVGSPCDLAIECMSGTCSGPRDEQRHCSRLCRQDSECAGALPTCDSANIEAPGGESQTFQICQ